MQLTELKGALSQQVDLELYQAETVRIATEQTALLDEACLILSTRKQLSRLDQNGVLHTLQVLIENSIGKAKQLIKAKNEPVPVSAYDAFRSLVRTGDIKQVGLEQWNSVIGLRNQKKPLFNALNSGFFMIC